MEELIKYVMDLRGNESMTIEEITKEVYEIYHKDESEIDRWYKAGNDFWMRRTSPAGYMSVQVFPVTQGSYLCYLHLLCIGDYTNKQVKRYIENAPEVPKELPRDIKYMYPIAISQDTECAAEMFLATYETQKKEWLNKMGIRGEEQ